MCIFIYFTRKIFLFCCVIMLFTVQLTNGRRFEYKMNVESCVSTNKTDSESDRLHQISLPPTVLDATVSNETSPVLIVRRGREELQCSGIKKTLTLSLLENDSAVAILNNSSSLASRPIWEKRAEVTFTTGGFLQIGENVLYSDQFCLNGFNDEQLEIEYCDTKCEDIAKVCIPKCCGPNQRISHDNLHCSAGDTSRHPIWFNLYESPYKQLYFAQQEKYSTYHMRFTRPSLAKNCKLDRIQGVSFSDLPIKGSKSKGKGFLQRLLSDGSIVFQQSPVHWRRLVLPDKNSYCVDTFFKSDLNDKYKDYKTEELNALFWCSESERDDLTPGVTWETTFLLISSLFYIVPLIVSSFFLKESHSVDFGVLALGVLLTAWNVMQVICYLVYPLNGTARNTYTSSVALEFFIELIYLGALVSLLALSTGHHSRQRGNDLETSSEATCRKCRCDRGGLSGGVFFGVTSIILTLTLSLGVQELAPEFPSNSGCYSDNGCRYYYVNILVIILWISILVLMISNCCHFQYQRTNTIWGQVILFTPIIGIVYFLEMVNYWKYAEETTEAMWISMIFFKTFMGPWYFLCFWDIFGIILTKKQSNTLELNNL